MMTVYPSTGILCLHILSLTSLEVQSFSLLPSCQLHPPKGGCLSKGFHPLTWHVDLCSY